MGLRKEWVVCRVHRTERLWTYVEAWASTYGPGGLGSVGRGVGFKVSGTV